MRASDGKRLVTNIVAAAGHMKMMTAVDIVE